MDLMDEEQHAADVIRARARKHAADALERADMTLAEPRPFAATLHEAQERAEREREEEQRWQRRAAPRAPAPTPAPPPVPTADDDLVRTDELVTILREVIDRERKDTDARIAAALAEANARISRVEARLAQSEGRLASVESKGAKRK